MKSQLKPLSTIPNKVTEMCLMEKVTGCSTDQDCENIDWVQCQECNAWYRCSCIGISVLYFQRENNFYCCKEDENAIELIALIQNCKRHNTVQSVGLKQMDVHSLFPCNGISDGIIDFFYMYNA